jgi:O-antigen ligase
LVSAASVTAGLSRWLTVLCVFVACLTAFDRGGNTAVSMFVAAVALLIAAALSVAANRDISWALKPSAIRTWLFALLTLLAVCGVGFLQLPSETWLALPGRSGYETVVRALAQPDVGIPTVRLSMAPLTGATSAMLVAACVALCVACVGLDDSRITVLLKALVAVAFVQAMIGLSQLALPGAMAVNIEYLGHVRAAGTFVNKNHFATFLAMLLPFALHQAILANREIGASHTRRRPLLLALWSVACVALIGGVLMSLSRGGIVAMLVGLATFLTCHIWSASKRKHARRNALRAAAIAILGTAALFFSSESFFRAISDRGAIGSLQARTEMTAATLRAASAFFPLGSGIGSFATAFPAFQPPTLTGFVEHAHNDYAQLLFEAGAFGIAFLLLTLLAAYRVARSIVERRLSPLGAACFSGAMVFATHAALDFPTRIPSIAFVATLLFTVACIEAKREVKERAIEPAA